MHYLVDAYNLLFRTLKKRGSLEKSRRQMIEELNDAVSQLNMQVTLVFDGAEDRLAHSSRGHFDAIELVFTTKDKTADAYISDEVMRAASPSQITVVTNDRELATRCRAHRAKTMPIDAFTAFVAKKKAKKKKSSLSSPKAFGASNSEIARLLLIFEMKMLEQIVEDEEEL